MKYWHMQIADTKYETEVILNKKLIPFGYWKEDSSSLSEFKETMKIGDIVLIKVKKNVIALVKIISDFKENINDILLYDYTRDIEVIKKIDNINNFPQSAVKLNMVENKNSLAFEYIENLYNLVINLDELYDNAKNILLKSRKSSASYLQRKLKISWTRANSIIKQLEFMNILSKPNKQYKRKLLVNSRISKRRIKRRIKK